MTRITPQVHQQTFGFANFEMEIAAFYENVYADLQARQDPNSSIALAIAEEVLKSGQPSVFQDVFQVDKKSGLFTESVPYDKEFDAVAYIHTTRGGEPIRVAGTDTLYLPMCDIATNPSIEFKELSNSRIPLYAKAYISLTKQVDTAAMILIHRAARHVGPFQMVNVFSENLPKAFTYFRKKGGGAHTILATALAYEQLKKEAKTNKDLHIFPEGEIGIGGIVGSYDGIPIYLPMNLPQDGSSLYVTDKPERLGVITTTTDIMVVPVDDRKRFRCGLVMYAQFGAGILNAESVLTLSTPTV